MNSNFQVRDVAYKQKIIDSFEEQQVMQTLNASILAIQPGEVILKLPYNHKFTQQHGFIHAGIISAILDNACGYAAFTLMPENTGVLSIEFKINFLSPAIGNWFCAIAKVKKAGKNITVAEGELFSNTDGKEKLVATMLGTIMTVYN
tara:strand:+ start:1438 stop:1878 length:441 start_codon:yes stop_codon:yes gene_type:complete